MTEATTAQNVVDAVAANIKRDVAGGLLSVTFPGWAKDIFLETVHAAHRLNWSPSQLAVFSLAMFLEGNGYIKPAPPQPKKPHLPADVEDLVRGALRYAIAGADATNKRERDAALDEVLVLLRAVLDDKTQEENPSDG